MLRRWFLPFLVFPFTILALVPSILLYISRGKSWSYMTPTASTPFFWLSLLIGATGITLALWSVSLFNRHGEGTAAPWDPPRRFVIKGPYCYVRNPMIIGVLLILSAESLFLRSGILTLWLILFAAIKAFYIPLIEEKGLEKRFGEEYREFKRNVPRWLPRLSAWHKQ